MLAVLLVASSAALVAPAQAQVSTTVTMTGSHDLADDHHHANGIWGRGGKIYIGDWNDDKVYTYNQSDMTHDSANSWDLDSRNSDPTGIAFEDDGSMILVTDGTFSSGGSRFYFRYAESNKAQPATANQRAYDFNSAAQKPRGMTTWKQGRVWHVDPEDKKAYVLHAGSAGSSEPHAPKISFHNDNAHAWGIWTDGTTVWISDTDDTYVYAYRMHDSSRDTSKEFDLHSDNDEPKGIWSDGTTMYVVDSNGADNDSKVYKYSIGHLVNEAPDAAGTFTYTSDADKPRGIAGTSNRLYISDDTDDKIYVYDRSATPARQTGEEFALAAANNDPRDVWTDGNHIWVAEERTGTVYAYGLSSKAAASGQNLTLHSDNAKPMGLWSDGTTTWVVDRADTYVYAYAASDGTRQDGTSGTSDLEFDLHASNTGPWGAWSDGTTVWITDNKSDWVYAYWLGGANKGDRRTAKEFRLDILNDSANGAWSDGDQLYVIERDETKVYIYDLDTAPVLNSPLPDEQIRTGASSTLTPGSSFGAPDGDTLTFSAAQSDSSALPGWLQLAPSTGALTVSGSQTEVGIVTITMTAADAHDRARDTFDLVVMRPRDLWAASLTMGGASGVYGYGSAYGALSHKTFASSGTDYAVAGLQYTPTSTSLVLTLDGDPRTSSNNLILDVAGYHFSLDSATVDAANNTFTWSANPFPFAPGNVGDRFYARLFPNTAPTVANPIVDRTAALGNAFSHVLPLDTFVDDDGRQHVLTYSAAQADGTALPSWLTFAPATRTFSGTPALSDIGTIDIKVTATDPFSGAVEDTFRITVSNSAPSFNSGTSTRDVQENTPAGQDIGTPVAATDPNNEVLTYTIDPAGAAVFDIDGSTGQLRTKAALDHETTPSYLVTVTATDGSNESDTIGVTITVTDVDEPPVLSGPTDVSYVAGANGAVAVYTASDPEDDPITWSLSGPDSGNFEILDGILSFKEPPSVDAPADSNQDNEYEVTVIVTASPSVSVDVMVTVTRRPSPPSRGYLQARPPKPRFPPVPEDVFADVTVGVHLPTINLLGDMGLFERSVCGKNIFCGDRPLKRSTAAVWIIRALEAQDPWFGGPERWFEHEPRFADADSWLYSTVAAERVWELGIMAACAADPLRFCPDEYVTRGQMASILVRAFDLPNAAPAGFADTKDTKHRADIDALARAGVTVGCAADPLRFCPDEYVTRGQMASFLARTLGLVPTHSLE